MTVTIIITFCVLLLIAYLFDLSASKTKIPSVILLLILGWSARRLTDYFDFKLPDLSSILPVLGTVGLILIVLEGALELELNSGKFKLIRKSFFGALFSLLALAFILAFSFKHFGGFSLRDSLINAIPLCVISSAIAIPSVRNLNEEQKEFVIYESSLSDILAVLIFNFLALNELINGLSFGEFILQVVIMIVISFFATISLSYMLNKIDHHIKFVPIILIVILIYTISKIYHLPGLIFVLLFGLFIGNLDELKKFKWIEKFKPEELNKEVQKFKEITIESAFLIRALFFLLFGYLIESVEVLNPETLTWTISIMVLIIIIRFIQIKLSRLPVNPLVCIAPRGLITILLFLSIESEHTISLVNKSLITQLIILSAFIMMLGLLTTKSNGIQPKH